MTHKSLDAAFDDLVDRHAMPGRIATGFMFTEGPIWHPLEDHLLFSDMPGDVRRRWTTDGKIVEVVRPADKCNGMTYDGNLDLIVCEHSTSRLMRESADGTRTVLASHFEGRELNSPNDVVVRSDGSIYFTDPWYGRMPVYGVERPRKLGWQGVFRLPTDGDLQLLVPRDMFEMPNGLCFSPDESVLYVNDTTRHLVRAFDVATDGTLRNERLFAEEIHSDDEAGVPDGMKCDALGNVWVTAPGGVWIYAPDGRPLGRIAVPEMVANLHWGGRGFRTLFLTASTSLYAMPTKVGPRIEPFMRAASAAASPGRT